mmetsp:Transcript_101110/g.286580  ORF Transcript_101110/g.286580 Transcript_101110/m.286580 type:complete len:294 (+) Transcript_101110:128-1009(+)
MAALPPSLEDSGALARYAAQNQRVPRSLVAETPPAERQRMFAEACVERLAQDMGEEGKCKKCMLQHEHCICQDLACLARETAESCMGDRVRFIVWMHPKERPRGSNTGKLVEHIIPGSEVLVHGVTAHVARFQELVAAAAGRVFVLFPSTDAVPAAPALLAAEDGSAAGEEAPGRGTGPLLVVLLDGTWRQAHRMHKSFEGLPMVALAPRERSEFHWRKQSMEGRISTVEAAALLLEDLGFPRSGAPCLLRLALAKLCRALGEQTHYDTIKDIPTVHKNPARLPKRRPGYRPA